MTEAADLSVCMIVKDEAAVIRRCLDSVAASAAELVVVDTGSSDETMPMAASYGAVTAEFDFSRIDFAAARNRSLELASRSWILVIDADEALTPAAAGHISRITDGTQNAGYIINRRNRPISNPGSYTEDQAVRLFPNRPWFRYRGRIHETVDQSLLDAGARLLQSGIVMDHFVAELDEERQRAKSERYLAVLLEELEADPADYGRYDFLAAEYFKLKRYDEAMEATRKITEVRPDDAVAHGNLGIYYLLHKGDPVRSRASLERSIELEPGYAESIFYLGVIDLDQGRIESGRALLARAVRLNPRLAPEAKELLAQFGPG